MAENLRHRRNNSEAPLQNNGNINIVLLGKTGVGKSSSGNTILGENRFPCGRSLSAVTAISSVERAEINGRSVSVVDTPGFSVLIFHKSSSPGSLRGVSISPLQEFMRFYSLCRTVDLQSRRKRY